ncbi:MAG: MSMEG_0565 family glycosyltransferase [Actinomycetota bacterium]
MRRRAGEPRVAILTYSTRPRGGVVHAVHLAEELHRLGAPVHLFALGDPSVGFYRQVSAPHTVAPAPAPAGTLEDRVFASVAALQEVLASEAGRFDIAHAEDCISARAATAVGTGGAPWLVVRTVHHVDDFTTEALIDCQRRSILEPDDVFVVSGFWRDLLRADYGVDATVVSNGVDAARFTRPGDFDPAPVRKGIGAGDRFCFLTVGGIEPRKGSMELIEALAELKRTLEAPPMLAVVGGHSFQDYAAYRSEVLGRAGTLGLELGRDVVVVGTVDDERMPSWYWSADAFAFPSVKEGWGLVVLEALAAGLPVVASDLPVFREYLRHDESALLVPARDAGSLAAAMRRLVCDPEIRRWLGSRGPEVATRFSWAASARDHATIYRRLWTEGVATR